jgi:hypothetical protein
MGAVMLVAAVCLDTSSGRVSIAEGLEPIFFRLRVDCTAIWGVLEA